MAASVEVSRTVHPFPLPSLSHLALIQVAIPLWKEFGVARLDVSFRSMQHESFKLLFQDSKDPLLILHNRIDTKLILIPSLLRKRVNEVVHGLELGVLKWRQDHSNVLELKDEEFTFYWHCDGWIDRIKTAQHLVLNANIDLRQRFDLACMYCLEGSIQTLWAEMEASGKTENIIAPLYSMVPFWVGRMRYGSQIPWTQAALEYLNTPQMHRYQVLILAWISFFPLLRTEDRQRFLSFFKYAQLDDLRICLYTMTAEEEKLVLESCAPEFLGLYFEWPLRSLFLQTTEKVWNYLDGTSFRNLLLHIFRQKYFWWEFDYFELVEDFWNMSPINLRERAKECPLIRRDIDLCLSEARKRREAEEEKKEQVLIKVLADKKKK